MSTAYARTGIELPVADGSRPTHARTDVLLPAGLGADTYATTEISISTTMEHTPTYASTDVQIIPIGGTGPYARTELAIIGVFGTLTGARISGRTRFTSPRE